MRQTIAAPLLAWVSACAVAATEAEVVAGNLVNLSLEQLGDIQVTTVSRAPERLVDAPASVYVITADAIRRSGATTLPEALRLAPNLQVARIDANQYAISARGFNSNTANKLQVLIDGRIVYTPLYSGVFWDVQDVMLEEVDRIEVISGPASTLWGTNAVNGVINVITRSSAETTGNLVSAGVGNLERGFAARHGGTLGETGNYRVYAKAQYFDHSERRDGSSVSDGWWRHQAGFRADRAEGANSVTVQGDAYADSIEYDAPGRQRADGGNLLARWNRALADGGELQVQAYWDHSSRSVPGLFGERLDVGQLSLQHTQPHDGGHKTIWGGGYRWADDRVDNRSALLAFLPAERRMHWANLFVQHERVLTPQLRLTLGARAGNNNFSGLEFMPNVRLAWKMAPDHLLWSAWSRSVRAPSRIDRDFFVPANAPFLLAGGRDFESEIARTTEVGYRGQFGEAASLSVTLFHSTYDRLRSLDSQPNGSFVLGNHIDGRVYGVEAWGSYRINSSWRLSAGVLAQHDRFEGDAVARTPPGDDPPVQWSLSSGWQLGENQSLDLAVRRVGALPTPPVPAYTAVDVRYGWQLSPSLALTLTVANLLDRRHEEFVVSAGGAAQVRRAAFLSIRMGF
ncbi:MAG TPA: TonB-dependent receptor [Aromatoleum sp.]|uniref:TonB-dependent receptor plug domain-containing protein n=1 Tax=Aromatoleum sp. TaxID=2307007 RepID=UPI002B45C08D|nr:TonB-dependent receptor [Aromatoleum sp.]HJV24185.1 TonB-dependent receptor [Aromatoleum sp.]